MIKNIHATAVCIDQAAILLLGKPGAGKSDLALRLIMNKNAVLIADDRVDIVDENGVFKAFCPQNIKGLLEVRGVGICHFPSIDSAEIKLIAQLIGQNEEITRYPEEQTQNLFGAEIPMIKIHPFEASAPDKILAACYQKR